MASDFPRFDFTGVAMPCPVGRTGNMHGGGASPVSAIAVQEVDLPGIGERTVIAVVQEGEPNGFCALLDQQAFDTLIQLLATCKMATGAKARAYARQLESGSETVQ